MQGAFLAQLPIGQVDDALQQIASSSILGLAIYVVLIVLSIYTWALIIKKVIDLRSEKRSAAKFRKRFSELEGNIVALSQEGILPSNSPARLFVSAYEELRLWATLDRDRNCIVSERPVINALERTLDRSIELEKEYWERGTTTLATIASAAPLLGLLGTVWGIFISFNEMGEMATASISTVAPGISEALLTTVVGLLVAIPAVFAYNGIVRAVRVIETQLESFAYEIINRFDRQIVVAPTQAQPQPRSPAEKPAARRSRAAT
ncbi:MAG: MotA/TolQ/ExbB proton channel family protein [Candidatus Hinthialibacter antarcticus]|nr:MotA/TolQ/ExbB proton channel family protein [Candidatus Hinthialibacter antarcticus]